MSRPNPKTIEKLRERMDAPGWQEAMRHHENTDQTAMKTTAPIAEERQVLDARIVDADRRVKESEKKVKDLEAKVAEAALDTVIMGVAISMGFIYPDVACRIIDRRAIVLDDHGEPRNIEKLLQVIVREKPGLLTATRGGGTPQRDPAQPSRGADGRYAQEQTYLSEREDLLRHGGYF